MSGVDQQVGVDPLDDGAQVAVLGLGVTGRAVSAALRGRGYEVVAIEDRPTPEIETFADEHALTLIARPEESELSDALQGAAAFLPSPGVPENHPAFEIVTETGVPTISEFDLARWWDDRPIAAITGTDGKTSVTLLTVELLVASGISAAAVGNTETPLVAAIDDATIDAFVVEASSFRLAHSARFAPSAAAWLNFSPDHLDVHRSLDDYEAAKAKIWQDLPEDAIAVAPIDDPVVRSHLPSNRSIVSVTAESIDPETRDASERYGEVVGTMLVLDGEELIDVNELPRAFPHDITNALTAAALAQHLGATVDGIRAGFRSFELPPHRIQYVETIDGVEFYNDSKATVPHAVTTAIESFESVVLLAGGRNKGIDLKPMSDGGEKVRSVVAIGEAADEIEAAFDGVAPVVRADDMNDAIAKCRDAAAPGDVVLLSPGCASFDAYENYTARGDHFVSIVHTLAAKTKAKAEESPT